MLIEIPFEELKASEIRRSRTLGFGFAGLGLLVLILFPRIDVALARVFKDDVGWLLPVLVFALAGYEFFMSAVARRIKSRRLLQWFRIAGAMEEVSIPSLVILITSVMLAPPLAMATPAVFLYFPFIVFGALRLDFRLSALSAFVAAAEYYALGMYNYMRVPPEADWGPLGEPYSYLAKTVLLFSTGMLAGFVTRDIQRRIGRAREIEDEKNHLRDVFGQHVSPIVVNKLMEQKTELDTEVRDVCVMFLDIRNFTTFAESRAPEAVVEHLNRLFGFMVDRVNSHHGIINKFLGDGFMAVFGAPLSDGADCRNAVAASRGILAQLQAEIDAGRLPQTSIGIGLHAGPAVTGNVGSRARKEYTIIGDVVNLASRVEQLNKTYGSHLLVTGEVWERLGADRGPDAESLGPVTVKGREAPVEIFRLA